MTEQAPHLPSSGEHDGMVPLSELLLGIFLDKLPATAVIRAAGDQQQADAIYSRMMGHALTELAQVVGTMCYLATERDAALDDFTRAARAAMVLAKANDEGMVGHA